MFDKNYKLLDATWDGISSAANQVGATPVVPHDLMSREYTIKEEGYVFMYVSNENATLVDVYFDDIVMTHTKSNVIQYNEYYPFGMQTANSWTRENTTGNNFLGNGGTELNTTTGVYDLHFRNYDPVLGRMNQVDPLADQYSSFSTYNFAFNDPVFWNDPLGDSPVDDANRSRNADIQRNQANTYRPIGDDMYGSMYAKEGVGTHDFIYDYENKKYVLPTYRNGQWGYWQKRRSWDFTTENYDEEGSGMMGELILLPDLWVGLNHSLDHYRTMANPIVQAIHQGQRDFVDNPFGGGLLAFMSGGGLMGAGGLVAKAALTSRAASALLDAGTQLAVNYASGSSLSKSLGQINVTSVTLSFASPGMKFGTMARNGMLSSAFTVNLNGGSQTLMNGDRSMTDVLISGGIGGAFSGLNSVGRNFAATSLWSGRSMLSGGISPSSSAYQATAYMWAGSKGISLISGGLSSITTNIYESGN